MEAMLMKTFAILLLFSVCSSRGNALHCSLSDLTVTQTTSGNVYTVTVENRCICTQSNVKLSCPGFASAKGVDPVIIRLDGDGKLCTLNNGGAVGMGPGFAVKFHYTASSRINFKPVSSTIACS